MSRKGYDLTGYTDGIRSMMMVGKIYFSLFFELFSLSQQFMRVCSLDQD